MTAHKHVVLCIQFPADYPKTQVLVELKSKTIPGKFLDSLVRVCDQEMSKHLGEKQVRDGVTMPVQHTQHDLPLTEGVSHLVLLESPSR